MADGGTGEKTEQPTQKRRREAREKGNVAKGKEIGQAFTLLASFLLLYILMHQIVGAVLNNFHFYFTELITEPFDVDIAFNILLTAFLSVIKIIYPILIVTAVAGVLINFLQIGALFTTKPLIPDLKKIDPLKGLKNIFSMRGLVELFKSFFKLGVIALVAYRFLAANLDIFQKSINQGLNESLAAIGVLISKMAFAIIAALIVLGVLDLLYQRWQHTKDLKMSKYEVKQERKEMEGDPMIKQHRRQRQRRMSMNRMMSAVKDADVVITNPTHIAVALQYDLDEMAAPVVVAKGEDYVAQKIKEKAREAEIKIVENKPLARSLNKLTEIGDQVPVELYQAVAEILAAIFREREI
ncbi:flagellar biosynthesis protein FlhB [Halanaerobium salsuginis]|jgi:flagellar biosynthetic protein FlhB|uniref:Flagellar biosynthetic protein FlhB n=1 Tax=Halanaerobium salsuginis TaxID=29563 RepID=A0A1I4KJE5_9FIRM|nr:flagellar biosynthesis protein FlhB [Halanaerobium salsuginis]SFL78636.1 flagellar biosynthetic protein FlhB [Halanaerobium salsuginis]